jgi:ubiquinone/menaquinone biosynthesis C-methylase UbiE
MTRHHNMRVIGPERESQAGGGNAVVAEVEAQVRRVFAQRGQSARYSWFDAAHRLAMQEVERAWLALLGAHGFSTLAGRDILDVGCGTGVWLRELVKWGASPERLAGVDLIEDRIAEARRLSPAGLQLTCGSAAALHHADASFDIVLQSLVFTSILDQNVRSLVASEMLRVLRPGGLVLWYDYHVNNPANPDVRAVTRHELGTLFHGCRIDLRRVTLAPPLARIAAPRSRTVYAALRSVPLLRTHYAAAILPR